jgi:hypothetical protein
MTRDEALNKLDEPLYDAAELEIDITYFCKKLRISRQQFNDLMKAPIHHYTDFPNWDGRYLKLKRLQAWVTKLLGREFKVYS